MDPNETDQLNPTEQPVGATPHTKNPKPEGPDLSSTPRGGRGLPEARGTGRK